MRVVDRLRYCLFCAAIVGIWGCFEAFAISNPPYEVYPYFAKGTDNPPVNYMKVCEPGRTGEEFSGRYPEKSANLVALLRYL